MDMDVLLKEQQDELLILTINRPQALNALNKEVFAALKAVFSEDLSASYRGIILSGAGNKAFAAGADIKEFIGLSKADAQRLSASGQEVFFLIEASTIPVIAAVQGFALGGGCELAMACHMIVAEEQALFGQPEVNLGLIPGYGATQRLVERIGKSKAIQYLLTADMISAQKAYAYGLVNQVVPQGQSVDAAKKILTKIKTKGPQAVAKILSIVYGDTKDGYKKESELFAQAMISDEANEGVQAFLEKRKPNF